MKHLIWCGLWIAICVTPPLDRASAQTPLAPPIVSGGPDELLLDSAVQEVVPPEAPAVEQETMLETPIPQTDLPLPEIPITKKTPLLLSAGPFVFVLSGLASVVSDNNIFNTTSARQSDILYTLTPRLMLGAGDYAEQKQSYLSAGFAPSFVTFQKRSHLNDTDYDTFIEDQYTFSKFRIGSRLSFQRITGDESDAPGRIRRDVYTASFQSEYALSDQTSIEVDGAYIHRDYQTETDTDEYLNKNFIAYLLNPSLQLALGGAFGTLRLADGQKQNYERPLLRLWYQPGLKLTLRALGGMEFRQFNDGASAHQTPVGDLGIVYVTSQSESTRLSLDGFRRVDSSPSTPGLNYVSTGVIFRVTQRFFRDLYLDTDAGYQHADYYPAANVSGAERKDNYYYVRPRIRYNVNDWGSVSLYYYWRTNDSSVADRSYENQHLGVELALGF
jgi:hypothetical protein